MNEKRIATYIACAAFLGILLATGRIVSTHSPVMAIAGIAPQTPSANTALQTPPGYPAPIEPPGFGATTEQNYPYPPGIAAIPPAIKTQDASLAAFSQADVVRYLAAHPFFKIVPGTTGGAVTRVLFIPAAQVSTMLRGEWIGRPDTTIVCYVEVAGPIDVTDGIDLSPRRGRQANQFKPAPKGILVFDAQTGNILLQSFGGY